MWSDDVSEVGKLIILSGPSGAGKSTVVRELLANCSLPLKLSVSATTRQPRAGEVDGRDYHFVSHEEFRRVRAAGEFLECKEVFGRGDWYGTLASEVENGLAAGNWMILEIDGRPYLGYAAWLEIMKIAPWPLRWIYWFRNFPPFRWAAKIGYGIVAKYRLKWFGTRECVIHGTRKPS